MLEYEGVQITWLGHDGFKLEDIGLIINTHTHEGNGVSSVQLYESARAYVQDGITFWLGMGVVLGTVMMAAPTASATSPRR